MKKQDVVVYVLGSLLFVIVVAVMVYVMFFNRPWAKNADRLNHELCKITGDANTIEDISSYIPFEWDTLYTFKPYVPIETIYQVVGYHWDKISQVTNEGMNQLVFLKDSKVVCYVYGYPKRNVVSFDFGEYEGDYLKLTKESPLTFTMVKDKHGIREFSYYNEESQ